MCYHYTISQCKFKPDGKMGWIKGFEPSALGTTIRCANQLSYTHHDILAPQTDFIWADMVRQKGLEPLTYCLEGSCSIHLSYWRIFLVLFRLYRLERAMGIEPTYPAWKAGVLPLNYARKKYGFEIITFIKPLVKIFAFLLRAKNKKLKYYDCNAVIMPIKVFIPAQLVTEPEGFQGSIVEY